MTHGSKILIVDDDKAVCSSLQLLLQRNAYQTKVLHHTSNIQEALYTYKPDLIILDLNFSIDTSGRKGLSCLRKIMEVRPDQLVILITGWATVQLAVEGMKLGARDFIAKPWDNKILLSSVDGLLQVFGTHEIKAATPVDDELIVGQSRALQEVLHLARKVAATDASVLITGDSGTGKELLAEMIHQQSTRRDRPFVKVNLGGISQSLFESEMFGHRKGAFTDAHIDRVGRFEKAHTGTIFLDEIGELDIASQVKLLRVLQEKSYEVLGSSEQKRSDFRIISATNQHLPSMISQGLFREDLFYRINLIQLHLPPLHDRREDIALLARRFCDQVVNTYGLSATELTSDALAWLQQQPYPGNIRQLKNTIERTILIHMHVPQIDREAVERSFHMLPESSQPDVLPPVGQMSLQQLEQKMIRKALAHHNYSISQTARSLGITRSALYRRLDKYQIPYEPED